jgi:hypothetical protein
VAEINKGGIRNPAKFFPKRSKNAGIPLCKITTKRRGQGAAGKIQPVLPEKFPRNLDFSGEIRILFLKIS